MVRIRITMEGGIVKNLNDNAQTIQNSEALRESFNKLFSSVLKDSIKIIIDIRGGIEHTINYYKKCVESDSQVLLLIDLDDSKIERNNKIISYGLSEYNESIFFMIQKMEAWILSQPNVIEECYSHLKSSTTKISTDNNILNKNIEDIPHPDFVLKTIFARYFEVLKNGKKSKFIYGKLKTTPILIQRLDIHKLMEDFEDAKLLIQRINSF